ncbi:MAG: MraY family glycosyltransferase, partial [Planctomycetota bacterium]
MLSLLEMWKDAFGPLRLFGFTSVRVVAAALTAFLLMLVFMPTLINWLRRKKIGEQGGKGEAELVDAMRDQKRGTPTMGGLGLIACAAISAMLWCHPGAEQTWLLITTLVVFGALGFIDDRTKVFKGAQGLGKGSKMLLQLIAGIGLGLWFGVIDEAAIVTSITPREAVHTPGHYAWSATFEWMSGFITVPFVGLESALPLGVIGLVVWTLVMTFACSNSVNFTDGLDGLAAGTMLIASLAYMVIAYLASHFVAAYYLGIFHVPGAQEVAVFCAAIAGACLGFLWYNAHPAQVFMGDTGSQALGGALAMVSLCAK